MRRAVFHGAADRIPLQGDAHLQNRVAGDTVDRRNLPKLFFIKFIFCCLCSLEKMGTFTGTWMGNSDLESSKQVKRFIMHKALKFLRIVICIC